MKRYVQRRVSECSRVLIINPTWKQPKCSAVSKTINKLYLHPGNRLVLSKVTTWQESQNIMLGERRLESKEYIVYNSTNDALELTHGDRHQKMVGCGLGGRHWIYSRGQREKVNFWVMEGFCFLGLVRVYEYSWPLAMPTPSEGSAFIDSINHGLKILKIYP